MPDKQCPGDQRQRSPSARRRTLRTIARKLARTVRSSVTIDWTLRALVKRILRTSGCPPDKQKKATRTVLEQAEAVSADWAAL